jgi:hypothetical protein
MSLHVSYFWCGYRLKEICSLLILTVAKYVCWEFSTMLNGALLNVWNTEQSLSNN